MYYSTMAVLSITVAVLGVLIESVTVGTEEDGTTLQLCLEAALQTAWELFLDKLLYINVTCYGISN